MLRLARDSWGGGGMADTGDLKSLGRRARAGSSPARPTLKR